MQLATAASKEALLAVDSVDMRALRVHILLSKIGFRLNAASRTVIAINKMMDEAIARISGVHSLRLPAQDLGAIWFMC